MYQPNIKGLTISTWGKQTNLRYEELTPFRRLEADDQGVEL